MVFIFIGVMCMYTSPNVNVHEHHACSVVDVRQIIIQTLIGQKKVIGSAGASPPSRIYNRAEFSVPRDPMTVLRACAHPQPRVCPA